MIVPNIAFRADFDVDLIDSMGNDHRVVGAARVSTKGADVTEAGETAGLIKFLMAGRHGSPFEHILMTWRITAPIFVWREFMRHRIASYNEESGRYKQLDPVFYIPGPERPLVQEGKAGAYTFVPGTEQQYRKVRTAHAVTAEYAYAEYENLLSLGIAKEVARITLPLNIYSTAYVTMNARGLMNFLSLRVKDDLSTYPSFPQWEINQVANKMEDHFANLAPQTWKAFVVNGRVAP